MALPLSLNLTVMRHRAIARLEGRTFRIPLVLMLEPAHAGELRCVGCGRIRKGADTRDLRLTRSQEKTTIPEADTLVVSISGGEPLIHQDVPGVASDQP